MARQSVGEREGCAAPRLHILGASGSGTSTLGAALAVELGAPHLDADSVFWLPTDPPFTAPRTRGERLVLLREILSPEGRWVFPGPALGRATPVEPWYTLVVYLTLDPSVRMDRLRRREIARFGERIAPGGDLADTHAKFLCWAAAYDTAGLEQRSRAEHEAWLEHDAGTWNPVSRNHHAITRA